MQKFSWGGGALKGEATVSTRYTKNECVSIVFGAWNEGHIFITCENVHYLLVISSLTTREVMVDAEVQLGRGAL